MAPGGEKSDGGPSNAHALEHTWVLWEHKQVNNKEDWKNSMREVCEFSTVEEFWKYWSFIPRPSEVLYDGKSHKQVDGRTIDAFSLFKKGIRPEWEDPENKNGAEFMCRKTMAPELLDQYWENMVLGLIGETIDAADDVCGCRVVDKSKKQSTRTMFRLEMWTRKIEQSSVDKLRTRLADALTDGEAGKPNSKVRVPEFEFKRRD